jgi:hypothetical protein
VIHFKQLKPKNSLDSAFLMVYFESKHIRFDSHTMIIEKSPEMRLFSPEGERLYLTAQERKRFLTALDEEDRENNKNTSD